MTVAGLIESLADLPSIHIYDGVRVGRDTTRVIDVLDKDGLTRTYEKAL
jgi:hypothetical protein